MMNSIFEIQGNIKAISAEAAGKTPELHQIANDVQQATDKVYSLFSDQAEGQSLVVELAQAQSHIRDAAIEIGMFDIKAQQIINQLAQ
jgi:hypothetical protein